MSFAQRKSDVYRGSLKYMSMVFDLLDKINDKHRHTRNQLFRTYQSIPFNLAVENRISNIIALLFVFIILLNMQCNLSTQSYNFGKILNPGEGTMTFGFGVRPMHDEREYLDGFQVVQDTVEINKFSFCLNYRLGILSRYPFGKGLEFGLNLEYPGQLSNVAGPPIADFDLRMGFNSRTLMKAIYHHNIGLGWTVGTWIDNGWFGEYASCFEFSKFIPYMNTRFMMTATDITEKESDPFDADFFEKHITRFNVRHCLGITLHLKKLPVLPDYITPECSFVYPNYSLQRKVGFSFHIGLGWSSGL